MKGVIERFLAACAWRYSMRGDFLETQVNNRHGGTRYRLRIPATGEFGPWVDGQPTDMIGAVRGSSLSVEEMAARLKPHGPVDAMPVGQLVFSLMSDGTAVVSAVPEEAVHLPTKPLTAGTPSWCWGYIYQRLYGRERAARLDGEMMSAP